MNTITKLLLLLLLAAPVAAQVRPVGYDAATRNVTPTDLDYVGASGNFTTLQVNSVAVVSEARTLTIAGTANEITSSAGAQSLAANRTWTLSLPAALTFTGKTITGGTYSSPTLTTPTIASFANATHDHSNAAGGGVLTPTAVGLTDPNADRILFWDDSAGAFAWLTAGSGLTITTTTMTASGGGGGSAPEGTMVNSGTPVQYAFTAYADTTGTNMIPTGITTDSTLTNLYAGNFYIDTLVITNDIELAGDLFVGGTAVITNGPIQLGLTGVTIAHDSDGALSLTGSSAGSDENWTINLDDTANTVVMSSSSGVTLFDYLTGSFAISMNSIELGSATANTLTASAGDLSIEGNRIFRVGGADVPVADGGTGLSSGTSGGVLYYSASGTLASSGALAANSLVVGGGAGSAPSTVTTGTGVLTALAITANSTGGFVTDNGTATLTGKNYDASATGNVLKQLKQLNLQRPDYGDGTGAVPQTNTFNASGLMHYTFSGSAETNANWVVYEFDVPSDIDTTVELTARFAFLSGGTDADDYVFHLTYATQAPGAAYVTGTSISTSPIVMTVTPTTAADGDLQQSSATTLTGWAAGLTAGRPMQVRVARLNNAQDNGARDVQLVITYSSTL